MSCPEKGVSISNDRGILNHDTLLMCSPGLNSYAFCSEKWTRMPYKSNCICISSQRNESGSASAVRLHCSIAYYSSKVFFS